MPRGKKLKPVPVEPNNPSPVLTLAAADELRRQYRLSSLLTHGDAWRLFYSHESHAGWVCPGDSHDRGFEDELQANQYFHQLRSEWLQETHGVAG